MNNEMKWRFPSNSYTSTTGLDTADMETFKSDANASLAREISQNSIDAKISGSKKPVLLKFKSFEIKKEEIPGYKDLISNVKNCIEYWTEFKSDKTVTALNKILKELERDKIRCLRISDYNTTGLVGISGIENSPWYNLIHGSGISEKSSTSGGSKGIGKFATFVNSHFRTVFYSTKTIKGEVGYEGICKLCSGKIPGSDEVTQGIGYFGVNDKNMPILSEFNLDSEYKRKDDEYGTDIYILGFKGESQWREEIIVKILDSFMSAIIYEMLEIEVDNITINKDTLKSIVYNEQIVKTKAKPKIISQYLLLQDKNTYVEEVEVDQLGKAKVFIRVFEGEESHFAENKCIMIRYPYMKIKDRKIQSLVKVGALCLIPDNKLNEKLREIENPQHTDWEFNRIEEPVIRNDFKNKIEDLYKKINDLITKYTLKKSQKTIELEGSEEFISVDDDIETTSNNQKIMKENELTEFTPKHRAKSNVNKGKVEDTLIENTIPDFGDFDPYDIELRIPNSDNDKKTEKQSDSEIRLWNDNDLRNVFRKVELRGLKFNFFCINKEQQQYLLAFTSDIEESDVELIIRGQDEGNYAISLYIYECSVNGVLAKVEDGEKIHLELKKGSNYRVVFKTRETELFACWVKAYAYKK